MTTGKFVSFPANIRRIPRKPGPQFTSQAYSAKKNSLDFLKSIEEIDEHLKDGLDTTAIIKIKSILNKPVEIESCFSELSHKRTRSSLTIKGLPSPPTNHISSRVRDFGIDKLKKCLSSFEDILYSLNRKKAFVLLNVLNIDELTNPDKVKDLSTILELLAVNENEQKNLVQIAIDLDKEIKGKATVNGTPIQPEKISSFMADNYIWYLKRIGLNDEQIEIESKKLNGKSFTQWAEEIKAILASKREAQAVRLFQARAEIAKQDINPVPKKSPLVTTNDIDAKPKIHKEPRRLNNEEIAELIFKTYKNTIHYPHDYEGFLKQFLAELNKHQAFRELELDKNKLETLLMEKLGLEKIHFDVITAYKEL